MYENRRPDVAVFIDFENVYVSVRDKLNANPNFEAIMDRCSDLGRVVISRAYADWYRYPRVTSALYANAIEPIYVATYYYDKDVGRTGRAIKNSVDMNLCIDAMKTLFTNPNISRFVLVTGDRDFIPLVNSIRQQGKEVYIIGIGGAASTHLAQSADEFVFYEQLVGKQPMATAAASAIANRAVEFSRASDQEAVPPPPRERERDRDRDRDRDREPAPPPVPAAPAEPEVYEVLVEAIHLVRKRGYVSTLGSIKLVMKELMGGDFKESRYKDLAGRPFAKFKDFVMDAEKRGKVQIFTNGTVNEVFLPGEDPYKLSQFAAALSEEAPIVEAVADVVVSTNGRKEPARAEAPPAEPAGSSQAPAGRRRRRRSRRGQGGGTNAEPLLELGEGEGEEPDYTAPDLEAPAMTAPLLEVPDLETALDELQALDALELPAELAALEEEQLPEELVAADRSAELDEAPVIEQPAAVAIPVEEAPVIEQPAAVAIPVELDEAPVVEPPASAEEAAPPPAIEEPPAAVEAVAPAIAEPAPPAVEAAPAAPVEASVAEAEVAAAATETGEEADEGEDEGEALEFTAEEWALFYTLMRGFSKPASFQQIFDALRNLRKEQSISRTNEQMRSLVKQAINTGVLERSGRGKRVYYALKSEA